MGSGPACGAGERWRSRSAIRQTPAVHDVPETRYASDGDVRIAYQVFGDGPVDLLFAMGGNIPIDIGWEDAGFERFMRRLGAFSRVVLFDSRGWGASRTSVETAPTVEVWADDLRLVLDTVGIERAAVMGFYAGAVMSMFFAAAHPERVASLVLIEASARMLRDHDFPIGMPADSRDRLIAGFVEAYGTGGDLIAQARSRMDDERFRRWWARCERMANGPSGAGAYWRALSSRDMRAVLPALRVPTLVLHRANDPFVRVGHGRYLAEHIPDARYVELDGEDHLFFVGDTDRMLDEIELFLTGAAASAEPDRLLASVLFTDIVGSTDTAAALGDRRWRELLDRHDSLTREHVARYRGRVVKTTGDGALATFDGPARAIRCAVALRDAVSAAGVELRAGIHTGEVEQRDGDIGGIAVHLAARVQALAAEREVLVSRTVADLVAGSGIEFSDRGEHELKGVPGRWRLLAVDES
jgi:class 3 adenylate cyclase